MVGFARGEPRVGGACRKLHRSRWGGVVSNESRRDDAADVAGPQLYAACIGGQLRCERVLASAGNALMLMGAVGWGGCVRGCSWWWGLPRGEPRGGGACRQ